MYPHSQVRTSATYEAVATWIEPSGRLGQHRDRVSFGMKTMAKLGVIKTPGSVTSTNRAQLTKTRCYYRFHSFCLSEIFVRLTYFLGPCSLARSSLLCLPSQKPSLGYIDFPLHFALIRGQDGEIRGQDAEPKSIVRHCSAHNRKWEDPPDSRGSKREVEKFDISTSRRAGIPSLAFDIPRSCSLAAAP